MRMPSVTSYNRKQINTISLKHIRKILDQNYSLATFRELMEYIAYDEIAYNTLEDVETEERLRLDY